MEIYSSMLDDDENFLLGIYYVGFRTYYQFKDKDEVLEFWNDCKVGTQGKSIFKISVWPHRKEEGGEMKFKDIKAGDTVYIQKEVSTGFFRRVYSFWIPVKVERVTPKQFIVEGEHYRKEDGVKISDTWECVKNLGDDDGWGKKVTDETEAMKAFIKKIKKAREIFSIADDLKSVDHDHSNLEEIHTALVGVKELLKTEED